MISLETENESAYYHRANLYYQLGNFDLAMADYDQSIRLNPNNASAYYQKLACSRMTRFEQTHTAFLENFGCRRPD